MHLRCAGAAASLLASMRGRRAAMLLQLASIVLGTAGLAQTSTTVPIAQVSRPQAKYSNLEAWLCSPETGGWVESSLAVSHSDLCGAGLLTSKGLSCDQLIGRMPLAACISAEAALEDPAIGSRARQVLEGTRFSQGGQAIVVAAVLAHARFCDGAARDRWAPYADSLPWATGSGEDPLGSHPLVQGADCTLARVGQFEERLAERLERARASAAHVYNVLGGEVPEEDCFRATVLVGSRAFDLSPHWARAAKQNAAERAGRCNWSITLVPFFDLANHPSMSSLDAAGALGSRFRQLPSPRYGVLHTICDFTDPEPRLSVYAPKGLELLEGDELLNYYGDAGIFERDDQARAIAEANFVAQYGFSPWS